MDNQNTLSEIEILKNQLQKAQLPANLHDKAVQQIERINLSLKYGGNLSQLDITAKYIDWICNLPWEIKTEDNLDIQHAKLLLDKNHYGLGQIKKRILEYLSLLIMQKKGGLIGVQHAP